MDTATVQPATAISAAAGMQERSRNPRGEGDRLRVDLLDAAADLLAETGAASKVSLRAVAARAGVSPTAVYRHFDDHLSLLRAAIEYCWAEFEEALAVAALQDVDPYTRIRICGLAYARFATEQPGKYRVLFSNQIDLGREQPAIGDSAFDYLVALVTDVFAVSGDDRDPRFVAVQVHTWIHGLVDLCCNHPDFEWPPLEVQIDELGFRLGIADPAWPAPTPWVSETVGPTSR